MITALTMISTSAARVTLWWVAGTPDVVTTPAAKALSREGKGMTPSVIQPLIPAIPSALTVRHATASTTMTTSVTQDTSTFADAEPATVKEQHVPRSPISSRFRRRIRKVKLCIDK